MLPLLGAAMGADEMGGEAPGVAVPFGVAAPRRCRIRIPLAEPVLDDMGRARFYPPGEADLSLLDSGTAPLLLDHRREVESLVGVVERAWIEADALHAIARLGPTLRCGEVWGLISARILVHVSMGMNFTPEKTEAGATLARGWRPFELSLVTVPRRWAAFVEPVQPDEARAGSDRNTRSDRSE